MRIAIDAGHGKNTAGKRCLKSIDPNATREWYLNDRIADKLEKLLKAYNCRTLRVNDTTGATDTALAARVKAANDWGANIYISIHHNAGISGGSGGGTVVYYYSSGNADMAKRLYNSVVRKTGLSGNRSSKVSRNTNLYVLKFTKMNALLLENGFMDSTVDTPIILTEEHAEKTAAGILDFLVSTYGLKRISNADPENGNGKGVSITEISGKIRVIYSGSDGVEVHNTPDFEASSRNSKYGPVGPGTEKGSVFTVTGKTSNGMYRLKSGLYITASEKYVEFY